jgi:hypothetical protein
MTHRLVFDYHPGDIYFCAADVGWITGHSYIVYGPLANGATTVMFESTPSYPDPEVVDRLIEEHRSRWSVGLARGSPAGRIMLPACVKGEDSRSWRWISSHRQLRS